MGVTMSAINTMGAIKRAGAAALAMLYAVAVALAPACASRADINAPAIGVHAATTTAVARNVDSNIDSSIGSLRPALASLAPSQQAEKPWTSASRVEPFGVQLAAAGDARLGEKWQGVREAMAAEADMLARCRADRLHCPSVGATRFLAIVDTAGKRDGRARLGAINRAVNLAIRPQSDLAQYGVIDRWAPPLDALARGAGDCEDYAITKYAALRVAGVDDADLRLVVVHDIRLREDHAVLAARLDGHWLVLDNRRLLMLEDSQLPDYVPLFMLGDEGAHPVDGYGLQAAAVASRAKAL